MTIETYLFELKAILRKTLSEQDIEEVSIETSDHLQERTDELISAGMSEAKAQNEAVRQFGDVSEIAQSIAKEFPPCPPFNVNAIRLLPEAILVIFVGLATFGYLQARQSQDVGNSIESAVSIVLGSTPMLVIPGIFAALSKIRFRRFRIAASISRLSAYGAGFAFVGIGTIAFVRFTNHQLFGGMDFYYGATAVATLLGYAFMRYLINQQSFRSALNPGQRR